MSKLDLSCVFRIFFQPPHLLQLPGYLTLGFFPTLQQLPPRMQCAAAIQFILITPIFNLLQNIVIQQFQ